MKPPIPTSPATPAPRAEWTTPEVTALPRLTELTLATGAAIPGGGNTGTGSTVIP